MMSITRKEAIALLTGLPAWASTPPPSVVASTNSIPEFRPPAQILTLSLGETVGPLDFQPVIAGVDVIYQGQRRLITAAEIWDALTE
jgi:hypothetical protein